MIRLQKVMADRGVASRRAAEELITEGRVRVEGELVTTLGTRVADDARIEVDGRPVAGPSPHRYVLMNKPVGIVSTAHDEHGRRTVVDQIGARERLYPVGRLDTDSEGLLLLTNDGTWAERVLHPRYGHEREYDVAVEGDLTDEALARLQRGIPLEEGIARAVRITVRSRSRGRSRISMVLRTGWKRQVRRMCLAVGLKVSRLVRVRMGPLELGRLRPGEFRDLTKREIDAMTAPMAQPPPQIRAEKTQAPAPQVTRRAPVRSIEPRTARRPPPRRTRVGPVESARTGAPRVTRRAGSSRARVEGPRRSPNAAPRVTRRAGSSRARVVGPRTSGPNTAPRVTRRAGSSRARTPSRGRTRGALHADATVHASRGRSCRAATRHTMTPRTIAIDGPAGAGKSTIGALVAERLGYLFLDTGAMYRAIALAARRNSVDPDDTERLAKLGRESRITIGPPTVRDGRAYTVLLDGADVTWEIRSPDVDRTVSQVARVPAVRDIMVDQQRELARRGRVVMVGRDIGTVVLPDADCKIYLTASAAERAKRREEELRSRGQVRPRQELLQEILGRDRMDSERKVAPLRTADDAAVVQTDGLSVGQALEKVLAIVTRPAPSA